MRHAYIPSLLPPPFLAVNKQINDKERIAAAMEKQELRELVEECLREPDY